MATVELSPDSLAGFDFDQRDFPYSNPYTPRMSSWPLPIDHDPLHGASQRVNNLKRSTSPTQDHAHSYEQATEWPLSQPSTTNLAYPLDTTFPQQFAQQYIFHASPTELIPIQPQLDCMDGSYHLVPNHEWDLQNSLMNFTTNGLPDMGLNFQSNNSRTYTQSQDHSPTFTNVEVRSNTSCSSDNGWNWVDNIHHSPNISFQEPNTGFIPNQAHRTPSEFSYSDIQFSSPGTDTSLRDSDSISENAHQPDYTQPLEDHTDLCNPPLAITSALARPIDIRTSSSPQTCFVSTQKSPPPGRRPSRKVANPKITKTPIQKPSQAPKVEEKRVGKRKGPLRPEARKAACEIRKLGACLRCRFLKKPCDKGEPCGGCKPSHARLWQVPCTRIDIKDIAYFLKDWTADYKRHFTLGNSIGNIKGFADAERTLFITHGYGHYLPVRAREVFVRDERCFDLDWVETIHALPEAFVVNTAKLTAGMEGISTPLLSDYLDRHIDTGFEEFVDEYFEGTPFLTEMLKTASRYLQREKTPVIRKCLKLLLAYNLTQHVTMVKGIGDEEGFEGKITDETSKFYGQTVAPVMINFQIKCALADMWRNLQKDILVELSRLYSSVYNTKDKLKHWPTIFMVATIMLGVWEEMQFDCNYRMPVGYPSTYIGIPPNSVQDIQAVNKFCYDMESKPVGVIVGLFAAISQKLPALSEWDSSKPEHRAQFDSNPAVCEALDEVREHVTHYGIFYPQRCCSLRNMLIQSADGYLRQRGSARFDRDDFDSLSGKFVSKLVIRAN